MIMYKCLGIITALLAFCSWVTCIYTIYMVNKFNYIDIENIGSKGQIELTKADVTYCPTTYIVNNIDSPHVTWTELFYLKWILLFTLIYSFCLMVVLCAVYLANLSINLLTANSMVILGFLLSLLLHLFIIMLKDKLPFGEIKCNQLVLYLIYFIAFNTSFSILYFLIYSFLYYFMLYLYELKLPF